jgi:hypothetical protein
MENGVPLVSDMDALCHRIAAAVRVGAMSAARFPGWSQLIMISGLLDSKVCEGLEIACTLAVRRLPTMPLSNFPARALSLTSSAERSL